jgi:hypothetical protein
MDGSEVGAVVLAGTSKAARHIRWKRRAGSMGSILGWRGDSKGFLENRITSWINRDDYIYGENKALLYMHPELVWAPNMAFFKRTIGFSRRSRDRLYRKRRDELLRFLSIEGKTSLEIVLRALEASRSIDPDNVVIVGPVDPIEKELQRSALKGRRVVKQGSSLGDNILIGKKALLDSGYRGEYFLTIGADMPILQSAHIDHFIQGCASRGGRPDIFYGMSSRHALGPAIDELEVSYLGTPGPNRPAKGNIKKFGIPIIDDVGLYGEKGARIPLLSANVLLYRTEAVDGKLINKLYSLRKMFANPFAYPRLIYNFGPPLARAMRWRMPLTEGERIFSRKVAVDLRVAPGHPLLALDLDSYTDLRRASAIQFGVKGKHRSLEVDFKQYIKDLRRKNRRRRRDAVG